MGEDRPPLGAVDDAAAVVAGQPAEALLIDQRPGKHRGQGGQVPGGKLAGTNRVWPNRAGQEREVVFAVLPGVAEDDGHVRGLLPARCGAASYRALSWVIMSGNWVTSGLLPG